MSLIRTTNPWTKNDEYNVQRSDLWILDLSDVITYLQDRVNVSLPDQYDFHYASSISFPATRITQKTFIRDSQPVNMPDYDEAVGAVRVTFLLDSPVSVKNSKIYNLLQSWRQLVRLGRGPMTDGDDFPADDQVVNYLTDPTSFDRILTNGNGFRFAFNLPVYFLKGAQIPVPSSDNPVDLANLTFETASGQMISQAWLSSIQLGEIQYQAGNQAVTVAAELFPESILQMKSDDVNIVFS